jgi:hypothetical protein
MDGELASTSATTYGAKFENGDFRSYSFSTSTNAWTVTDKNGISYKFGSTAASRQDPGGSTTIYKWMLDEIRDANNNYIKFTYTKDAGQIYPSSIVYTGNGTTDGPFTVNFVNEARSDHYPSYKTGYSVTTSYRINEIDVLVSGTWVKKYLLTYGTGDNGVRSMLSQITEEGQDDSSNTITLPGTTASYATSSRQWTQNTGWGGGGDGGSGLTYIDVNGDGLTDYIYTVTGQQQVYISALPRSCLPNYRMDGLLFFRNTCRGPRVYLGTLIRELAGALEDVVGLRWIANPVRRPARNCGAHPAISPRNKGGNTTPIRALSNHGQ